MINNITDSDDTPWVKLTTVGLQHDSQVLAHIENDSCHVMTDYLSRFCLVGQSSNQMGAIKALYLLIFGKPMSTSSLDFCVSVQLTDRTPSALEVALRYVLYVYGKRIRYNAIAALD